MKSVAIVSKPSKAELKELAPRVLQWLKAHQYRVLVDAETAEYVPGCEVVKREQIAAQHPDFVLVLGGDGTILAAARAVAKAGIPLLGVNLGSLGFLTEVPIAELFPTLEELHRNKCATDKRSMVHCQLTRNAKCVASYEALNDAVVNKSALARLSEFDLYIDRAFVSNYKADGMIVATPTGSTAYSLAAGGPIVMPDADVFLLSPVSPHALTHRPLVVRDTAEITIAVKNAGEEAFLSIDGQVGTPVLDGDLIICNKSEHHIRLLRMSERTFFDVLRTKLKWGER